jgi:hypothetical protein
MEKKSIKIELYEDNWIRSLWCIDTIIQMEEFTLLFMAITSVQLSNQKDSIVWRWARDGKYTIAYAYDCQFKGSFSHFRASAIWKALTEPKCRFYAWLVFHNWVLTADNMLKRNWPCNQTCALCLCSTETIDICLLDAITLKRCGTL